MKQNSTITFQEFLKLQKAIKSTLIQQLNSRVLFDISRAQKTHECFEKVKDEIEVLLSHQSAYLAVVVDAMDWSKFTTREFTRLREVYGEAVTQIMMIDRNFSMWLKSNSSKEGIITTGGACALESIDTKILKILTQNNKLIEGTQYVKEVALRAPTWTQVTGTLIPRHGLNIMYDETFPWNLRLEEYGIQDAEFVTQRIYDGIFHAVRRYVRLFDPNSTTVAIPFTELKLKKRGLIREWNTMVEPYVEDLVNQYGLSHKKHNPDNQLKAWVLYTYFGPEILSLVKTFLKEKYPTLYQKYLLDNVTLHVRGKQIDHLDTERSNSWMHSIILKQTDSKILQDRKATILTPYHCQEVAQFQWLFDNAHKLQTGFAGFLDSNYQGRLLHEESVISRSDLKNKISKGLNSDYYDSPLRLNSQNVEETIQFLERFKNINSISISKNTLLEFQSIKKRTKNIQRKIVLLEDFISIFTVVHDLFEKKSTKSSKEYIVNPNKVTQKILKKMKGIFVIRFENDTFLKRDLHINSIENKESANFIRSFFDKIAINSQVEATVDQIFIKFVLKKSPLIVKQSQQRLLKLRDEKKEVDETFQNLMIAVSDNISGASVDEHAKYINILPLSENYFVTYMQRLFFIKSVRDAFVDMESIESNDKIQIDEKETMIVEIIRKIFPVVVDCIRFIMIGGDYPWDSRFKYQYSGS